jgi:hypothetical protein
MPGHVAISGRGNLRIECHSPKTIRQDARGCIADIAGQGTDSPRLAPPAVNSFIDGWGKLRR